MKRIGRVRKKRNVGRRSFETGWDVDSDGGSRRLKPNTDWTRDGRSL